MRVIVPDVFDKFYLNMDLHESLAQAAKDTKPNIWGWQLLDGADNGPYSSIPGGFVVANWWRFLNNRDAPLSAYTWQYNELPKLKAAGKKIILRIEDPRHYKKWGGVPFTAAALGEFNAWVAQVIAWARPYIYAVQFWNEVAELDSNEYYLVGHNGQRIDPWYAMCVQQWSYKTAKAVAPEIIVLSQALGNPHKHSWERKVYDAGMAQWCDGLSLHLYNSIPVDWYRDFAARWGKPIYVTEANNSGGYNAGTITTLRMQSGDAFGDLLEMFGPFCWQGIGELQKFTSRQYPGKTE
jgi:hypothetical protein